MTGCRNRNGQFAKCATGGRTLLGTAYSGRPLSAATPKLPPVITHRNMEPILNAISDHPYFQPGPQTAKRPAWVDREVVLEMPTGELLKDGLSTMALLGRRPRPVPISLTGKEGFSAQGLEGKVQIHKDLFSAMMNLRDILPPHRGRILVGRKG